MKTSNLAVLFHFPKRQSLLPLNAFELFSTFLPALFLLEFATTRLWLAASGDLSHRKQWPHRHLFPSCTVPAAELKSLSYLMGQANELEAAENNFRMQEAKQPVLDRC